MASSLTDPSWRDAIEREQRTYIAERQKRHLELWDLTTGQSSTWGGMPGTQYDTSKLADKGIWRVCKNAEGGPINIFFPDKEKIKAGLNNGNNVLYEWITPDGKINAKATSPGGCASIIKSGFPRDVR